MRFILKFFGLLKEEKEKKAFDEFSAAEKKALIKSAAREANKMQKDLVEEYHKKFGTNTVKKHNGHLPIAIGL